MYRYLNGHTAAVFVNFEKKPTKEQLIEKLGEHSRDSRRKQNLPSAPKQFIQYLEEDNRPQVKLDVDYENGMGVSHWTSREKIRMFDLQICRPCPTTQSEEQQAELFSAQKLLTAKGLYSGKIIDTRAKKSEATEFAHKWL